MDTPETPTDGAERPMVDITPHDAPVAGKKPKQVHRRPAVLCGAKNRQGNPCTQPPAPGSTRCRFHGGHSLKGPANPAFKTGLRSKYIPVRLAARYEAAQNDPQYVSLRADLALSEARLQELLERIDTGESGSMWRRLRKQYAELSAANRQHDTKAMAAALTELGKLIDAGAAEEVVWNDIFKVIEQRRKLAEIEAKTITSMRMTLTAEEALTLLGAVIQAVGGQVKRYVSDPQEARAVIAGVADVIQGLATREGSLGPAGAGSTGVGS